jgi:shikimate dehydrogenase
MTKSMGIIGYPLGHTLSPVFQQAGLDHLGIDATFSAWPTPPSELEATISSWRAESFLAGCVTLPHKQAVMALVDEIDETAKLIGAVNWIMNRNGTLIGYNTDSPGFLRALRQMAGFDPAGKSAVVFGAGGVARAIVHGLRTAGVTKLTIANRTPGRARQLAADLADGRFKPNPIGLGRDELADVVPYADLLVNATSMGMAGGDAASETPVTAELVSADSLAYDAVYAPPMTPFLREVERAGGAVAGGQSMLVLQGVEGFELATGRDAPVDVMFEAIARATRGA